MNKEEIIAEVLDLKREYNSSHYPPYKVGWNQSVSNVANVLRNEFSKDMDLVNDHDLFDLILKMKKKEYAGDYIESVDYTKGWNQAINSVLWTLSGYFRGMESDSFEGIVKKIDDYVNKA